MVASCGANITRCLTRGNAALSGAGLAAGASVLLTTDSSVWVNNAATHNGGAMLFEGIPGSALVNGTATAAVGGITWRNISAVANSAVVGGGVYWGLPLPYSSRDTPLPTGQCRNCTLLRNTGGDVSTSAVAVALYPVGTSITQMQLASGMRIADYVLEETERPRVALLDALGTPARLDNTTVCAVAISNSTDPTATVAPLFVQAAAGVLRFDGLVVRGNPDTRLELQTQCTLTSPLGGSLPVTTIVRATVNSCLPGWDLTSDRVCRRCLPGAYSPHGKLCKPCPEAADCEDVLGEGDKEVCCGAHAGWQAVLVVA